MVKAEKKSVENNIVFIGSKFTSEPSNSINKFLQENPSKAERTEFQNLLKVFRQNPYALISKDFETNKKFGSITFDYDFAKKYMKSELVRKYFNLSEMMMFLSDEKRIKILSAVADLGLTLYGSEKYRDDYFYESTLNLCYDSKKIFSVQDNTDAYNSSKIGINVSHLQAVSAFPWRVLDILQSNACLVSDYHKDFDNLFLKDLFPIYRDEYEAREICKTLLRNEAMRQKIVKRCQEYCRENFGFDKVAKKINKLIGQEIL